MRVYARYRSQYDKEAIVGKWTLLILPAVLTLILTPDILNLIDSWFFHIAGFGNLCIILYVGWKLGKKLSYLPAFPIVVFFGGLYALLQLYPPFTSLHSYADIITLATSFIFGLVASLVITFLSTEKPRSPFLLVRAYNALQPKHRALVDIFGIICCTAVLVIAIFNADEVPKFAYNYLEISSYNRMKTISKQSYDIDTLIDRKRNAELDLSDLTKITQAFMSKFKEQQQTIEELRSIMQSQSQIPFLPKEFREYHQLKQRWMTAHTEWLEKFYTIKKLEQKVEDLLLALNKGKLALQDIYTNNPTTITEQLQTARVRAAQVKQVLSEMNAEKTLTEDLEDYLSIDAKKLVDLAKILEENANDATVSSELTNQIREIGERGKDMDYYAIYPVWRKAIIEPIAETKNKAFDESNRLHAEIVNIVENRATLRDAISPLANRLHLLPKEEYPDFDSEPLPRLPSEAAVFYRYYENPYVQHIRKALDAFLAGTDASVFTKQDAITAKNSDGYIYGLKSFDPEYYKGKFIVLSIDSSANGGYYVTLIFQKMPDRFFVAWVTKRSPTAYELQSFASSEYSDPEVIRTIQRKFKDFLSDPVHAL